ncbi:hypothetical protein KAU15_05595, partial [candidate division WOR-3 bacterium]|nr:hypothetical protein [candidate division WOR-3 bacterium]
MKRKIIIIIIFIILNINIFTFTDELRENGYKLNKVFMHKYSKLIEKYPNIRNFMFRPSDRQLISFDSKALNDTVTVLVLKV